MRMFDSMRHMCTKYEISMFKPVTTRCAQLMLTMTTMIPTKTMTYDEQSMIVNGFLFDKPNDPKPVCYTHYLRQFIISIGGSRGACRVHATPYGTQFFRFRIHFHRKVPASEVYAPPNGCTPPPTGNPGSVTDKVILIVNTYCLSSSCIALTLDLIFSADVFMVYFSNKLKSS